MKPYIQSTTYTTAACALLAILHNINPETPFTKEEEFAIWHATANLPTRASSIYALAHYAHAQNIPVKVIVEKKEHSFPDYRFYRYTKEDIEHAGFSSKQHQQRAENAGIEIQECKITLQTIQQELSKNKAILLRVNAKPIRNEKRNTSNYIAVYGFSDDMFHISDPAIGGISIPKDVFEAAFTSLETKKFRDHRMIVFG